MSAGITLNFSVYPLVVGQLDKYTFSEYQEEGGSIQLTAQIHTEGYTQEDIRWSSSSPDVAVVEHGLVQAVTTGITDICAQLPNDDCAFCRIQVIDNIARLTVLDVKLNTEKLILNEQDGASLYPLVLPIDLFQNGRLDTAFHWSSSKPDVVAVDHRGRVFGLQCGKAVVTGVSKDVGRRVSCQVKVINKELKDLDQHPLEDYEGGNISAAVGIKQQLVLPEPVKNQPVSWCTENAHIASVDQDGFVHTYRPGQVTVWATFIRGGHRVRFELEVQQLPEQKVTSIHLSRQKIRLAAGSQTNLYAAVLPATVLEKQLIWNCSDESVCKIVKQHINLSGLDEIIIEGLREGTAVVKGSCDGQEVSCCILVAKEEIPIRELSLPASVELESEQVQKVDVRWNEEAVCPKVYWISDNRRIVTADRDGVLKGYEPGEAVLYCIAADAMNDAQEDSCRRLQSVRCIQESSADAEALNELLGQCVYASSKISVQAQSPCLYNLHIPEESITCNSVCLVWNRRSLLDTGSFEHYEIYCDGKKLAAAHQISYTVKNLAADKEHTFEVAAIADNGDELCRQKVTAQTKKKASVILDVTKAPYFAVGDGIATDTYAIQRAIDDCPHGGVVLLPEGYVFYSGALFLKSHMTLQVDGILFGSQDSADYPPVVCRWEGYRKLRLTEENQKNTVPVFEENVYSHASLINAGVYDEGEAGQKSPCHTEDIRICGTGMINANGFSLSYNEGPCWYIFRKGLPVPQSPKRDQNIRGRVIAIYNARNVYLSDITVAYGPAWTIHPVFSENITIDHVKVITMGNGRTGATEGMLTLNGDGIDPDSCTNMTIMGCYFTVGDDAVAIKSGRNRQGNELAKPCAYIRVTDCVCVDAKGSFCIGSEQAGGAHDILFQNLYAENLINFGLWIKSAPFRGGLVEDILFRDCTLKNTGGAMQIEYNHKGEEDPSLVLPETRYITYENIHIQGRNKFGVRIMGVPDSPIHDITLRGFFYEEFEAYKDREFILSECKNIKMENAELPEGYEWEWESINGTK